MMKAGIFSEHAVEIIFCMLRWLFFTVSVSIFIYMDITDTMPFSIYYYTALSIFGFLYMLASHIVTVRCNPGAHLYLYATRSGVVFDYIAFLLLIELTGGVNSVLFPIAFLIIMHAAVYWRLKGGVISGFMLAAGYAVIGFGQGMGHDDGLIIRYLFDVMLLVLVGFLSGLIIARERFLTDKSRALQELVLLDPLTNLNNHRHFHEKTDALLKEGTAFFLVMGDVDFFKQINDQYGHKTGDYVLKYIGEKLKNGLQKENGQAFRYGGEEFSILYLSDKQSVVEQSLSALKQSFEQLPFSDAIKVTMSFGAAYSKNGELSTDDLINRADKCLYEAKANGRNRAVFYSG